MEPAIQTIWDEDTAVRTSDTDFLQRWKLSAFFQTMMEVASRHAAHLGYDYRSLLDQEVVWILSRAKIYIHDYPVRGESIHLKTWPKGHQQKLFFMRDFQITGSEGRRLASVTYAYVLMNSRLRRIMLSHPLYGKIPDNQGLSVVDEQLEKIPAVEPVETIFTTQAFYSAVDLMGHVNNARYVDWISDCFPFDLYKARRPDWLQINYINEVLPGEQVAIARAPYPNDPDTFYVTGTKQGSNLRAFEAAIHWK